MIASFDAEKAFDKPKTHPGLGVGVTGEGAEAFSKLRIGKLASRILVKINLLLASQADKLNALLLGATPATPHHCDSVQCQGSKPPLVHKPQHSGID